jgi:solute carrier family 13 (sodium-dependent dicarboxylate transporter), member 2/3/5
LLLIGAAPNAIAYESKQFTPGEFFRHGLLLSIGLIAIIGIAIVTMWPLLGMPTLMK